MRTGAIDAVKKFPTEALVWIIGLTALAIYSPGLHAAHFTLCPFRNLGFNFCPGCGLGRSVSLLFHGQVRESFEAHPLGGFAVIILTFRIVQLLKLYYKNYGKSN